MPLSEYIEQFELTNPKTGESHTVQVTIDMERIVTQMGYRAVKSTGGRCQDGHVVVRHLRPKKTKTKES